MQNNRFCKHNFYVVPDMYMKVPILMGADLIGRGNFTWIASRSVIKWSGKKYEVRDSGVEMCRSVNLLIESEENHRVLQLKKKLELEPNEFLYVTLKS